LQNSRLGGRKKKVRRSVEKAIEKSGQCVHLIGRAGNLFPKGPSQQPKKEGDRPAREGKVVLVMTARERRAGKKKSATKSGNRKRKILRIPKRNSMQKREETSQPDFALSRKGPIDYLTGQSGGKVRVLPDENQGEEQPCQK